MYPRARTLAKLDAARFRADQRRYNALTPATDISPSKIRAPDGPYRPPPSPWVPSPRKRWPVPNRGYCLLWAVVWVAVNVWRLVLLVCAVLLAVPRLSWGVCSAVAGRTMRVAVAVVRAVVGRVGVGYEALLHNRLRYRVQLAIRVFLAQTKVRVVLVMGFLWMLAAVPSHVNDDKKGDRVGVVESLYQVGGKAGGVIWTPDRTSGHEGSSSHYREEDWVRWVEGVGVPWNRTAGRSGTFEGIWGREEEIDVGMDADELVVVETQEGGALAVEKQEPDDSDRLQDDSNVSGTTKPTAVSADEERQQVLFRLWQWGVGKVTQMLHC